MIATSINDADKNEDHTYGIDFTYNTDKFLRNKNFRVEGYLADNKTPGIKHRTRAGRLYIQYPNDLVHIQMMAHNIGENYNPVTGYVIRSGIKHYRVDFDYTPRPKLPFVRKLWFNIIDWKYITDMHDKLVTRETKITPFAVYATTGEYIRWNVYERYEYLDEEFKIFSDVVIPRGIYKWLYHEFRPFVHSFYLILAKIDYICTL